MDAKANLERPTNEYRRPGAEERMGGEIEQFLDSEGD
jgi:hypothetical protein